VAGDSSPLGGFISGTWERVFEGPHHAIFRFRQNYPRRCSTTNVKQRMIPIVIDWIFATGHDNPIWAVTWHVDQATPDIAQNVLYDDSRAPYGELNIDGEGFTDIDGVAWGDEYKFTSTGATPVNLTRSWTWNVPNTVPYVKEWIDGPLSGTNTKNATMGIVQTQTRAQQDAGGGRDPDVGSDITGLWGTTSAVAGNGCDHTNPPWNPERIHSFPCADDWPYQANANTLDYIYGLGQTGDPNARMTWKTQYGFLGQTAYALNDGTGATAPGWPKKSYSTYIVLGEHTAVPNPVDAQVAQVERMQTVVLNAGTGSVVLQGPAGIDRNDLVTYDPPGYNHVYGALAFDAAANQLDAYIDVASGPLVKPLVIVGNYTAGLPDTVRWNGVAMTPDVDYFASLRLPAHELWITINRNVLAGIQSRLEIVTSATVPDPPTMQDGAPGDGSASFPFTPPANDGGSPITGYTATCHPWGSPETVTGTAVASPIVVNGLTNDLYYVCSMVATNNIGSSAPSNLAYASPIPAFSEPRQFIAVGFTSTQVYLSWNVVPAAETYHVYRAPNAVDYVDIGTTAGATNSYTDAGLTPNTTYLYKVKAARGVELSGFSAVDAATPIAFTDDPLTGGTSKIKAVHITQLRAGVNAVRAAAGLTPYPFTDGSLAGVNVKLVHLTQLRTALNQARAALGLSAAPFSAATGVALAASFTEVREAIK